MDHAPLIIDVPSGNGMIRYLPHHGNDKTEFMFFFDRSYRIRNQILKCNDMKLRLTAQQLWSIHTILSGGESNIQSHTNRNSGVLYHYHLEHYPNPLQKKVFKKWFSPNGVHPLTLHQCSMAIRINNKNQLMGHIEIYYGSGQTMRVDGNKQFKPRMVALNIHIQPDAHLSLKKTRKTKEAQHFFELCSKCFNWWLACWEKQRQQTITHPNQITPLFKLVNNPKTKQVYQRWQDHLDNKKLTETNTEINSKNTP